MSEVEESPASAGLPMSEVEESPASAGLPMSEVEESPASTGLPMSEAEEYPASTGLPMSELEESPASTGHKWFNRKPRPTRSDSSNNWRSKSNNHPLGESCSGNNSVFSRDQDRTSRFKFRPSSSEIERWLDNQVTNPITNLISYLSSPEGLHMVAQIVENRSLSPRIVIKLTKLVTQEGIRSSTEKHATNKIYGVFLGSAFLAQIQAYIGDILEPTAQDLWPFIHLFDVIQNRTADGWRFLPVETLREAINGIPEHAEKIELYQHFSNLVQFRNKFKMLQQLSKSEGCSQVRVTKIFTQIFYNHSYYMPLVSRGSVIYGQGLMG